MDIVHDTVLVVVYVQNTYIVHDTILACSAIPYNGDRLQYRMMEIDTILYVHDGDRSQYLQHLSMEIDTLLYL